MDISFQLYSARNFTPWSDVYKLLADQGYRKVEGFGGVYDDPDKTRKQMDENGLSMPSGHFFPIGQFEDELDNTLKTARTLGMERLFCPAPEDEFRNGTNAQAWVALAKRIEIVAKRVQDAGLRFGWHNHHWEFMPLPGGEIAMELIFEHAPSIEWEIDVAWIVRANADPIDWIERNGDRITTVHVKDIAQKGTCEDEDGWSDVGHGVMDWSAIMSKLRDTKADLYIMEHDNPNDLLRFASRSIKSNLIQQET